MERVPLKKVRKNKANPRKISDAKFDKLVESILVFPKMLELRPLVIDGEGVVLGGNMRLLALRKIATWDMADITTRLRRVADYDKMPEKETLLSFWRSWLQKPDVPVVAAADLSDDERRQFAIKDNASYGEWDIDILRDAWDDIDLAEWGVDIDLSWGEDMPTDDEVKETTEDDYAETADGVARRVQRGDIWLLGRHRVMCGDSTDAAAVALLMDGERADITFTSPPYNMSGGFKTVKSPERAYIWDGGRQYEEYADDLKDEEYSTFLCAALSNALQYSHDVFFNIGTVKGALKGTAQFLGANSRYFAGVVCWKKSGAFMPGFDVQYGILRNVQEPIYCFNTRGTRKFMFPQWRKGFAIDNFFESANDMGGNKYAGVHKATFPVELPTHFITNFTKGSVLDLFGGTGTTLIAAEQTGRKCFMMELSESYCDIILDRWEQLTGQTAVKIEDK